MLQSLSSTDEGLHDGRLATFLKLNPRASVLESSVLKGSLRKLFLNNSQNSQENTCVGFYF